MIFYFYHILTLCCSLPILNKIICPNLGHFQLQNNHHVMHLPVETFQWWGIQNIELCCNTVLFFVVDVCLCLYHYYVYCTVNVCNYAVIFTFVSLFHVYKYSHGPHLSKWNLCCCIWSCNGSAQLSNGRVSDINILTYSNSLRVQELCSCLHYKINITTEFTCKTMHYHKLYYYYLWHIYVTHLLIFALFF